MAPDYGNNKSATLSLKFSLGTERITYYRKSSLDTDYHSVFLQLEIPSQE